MTRPTGWNSTVDVFACPVCRGRGRVDDYADRPDPCGGCDGSGEIAFRWVELDGWTECEDAEVQAGLFA